MTTIQQHPDRSTYWPTRVLRVRPSPFAVTLAAFLAELPVTPTTVGDANLATHTRLRCDSAQGDRVHRLDSARGLKFYTTGCGLRVAKVAGTLTADAIDCLHYGCGRGRDGEA